MKWVLAALLIAGVALVALGLPFGGVQPERAPRFGGDLAVLPMTFAHESHFGMACARCHHEFAERLAGPSCMACHATDPKVAPLLEAQFHELCRSCHVTEHVAGNPSGPTRRCVACHLDDQAF